MDVTSKKNKVLETLNGTLLSCDSESSMKFHLLSKQYGKLLLIFDADLEGDLRLNLWKDVKVIGYRNKNSNLFVPIEVIPPGPSQPRAKLFKNIKMKNFDLKNRVPENQNSFLVAV